MGATCVAFTAFAVVAQTQPLGTLRKPRRRRQRGHGKTKDLIGRIMAQHMRFKTLYIS